MALPPGGGGQVVWRKERVWREPALIPLRLWGSWGLGTCTAREPHLAAQRAGDTGVSSPKVVSWGKREIAQGLSELLNSFRNVLTAVGWLAVCGARSA